MKLVKIVLGTLAGLLALVQSIDLTILIRNGERLSSVLTALAILCVAAVLSMELFLSAFAKAKASRAEASGQVASNNDL